ncbi:MAG: carboxymuconolactone decarboxylase family protein [Verrucomicrobiaceae bacterium]|nr:MAG: carboxymuconolactone decarboxylase family protein [Verrucomicrobiaceae bacterium]
MSDENTTPKARIEHWKTAPDAMKAMMALESAVRSSGIDPKLYDLIKLRASQVNGCAYCIDMHFNDLLKAGESAQRLNLLPIWREAAPLYTPAERAVLRWTEALTALPGGHVTDADFAELRAHFSEKEIPELTLAIATINAWNRFGVGFRLPVAPLT